METKTIKMSLFFAVLFYFFITPAAFAFTADSILSHDIKEADGTTGQDTNTGAGVKTGHIQDGAVTTGKVADGAISANKVVDGAITTGKIADGAVTDAKITGPISPSKISSAGLNADTVDGIHAADLAPAVHTHDQSQVTGLEASLAGKSDVTHNHDTLYQQKYGKVAVVAQTGGDYSSPTAAMNALSSWCGTPSSTNRCLLKIQPGIYDLAGGTISTQPYIDVEGSGENVTIITSTSRVFYCTDNVELRFLTAKSTGGGSYSTAIYVAGSTRLSHITAIASGGSGDNTGIDIRFGAPTLSDITVDLQDSIGRNWGIITGSTGTVKIRNADITAGNAPLDYGIGGYSSNTVLSNVTINAFGGPNYNPAGCCYGIWSSGGTLSIANSDILGDTMAVSTSVVTRIQNSTLKGTQYSIWATNGIDARLAGTQLDKPIYPLTSDLTCFNVYDTDYLPVTCP